jgi:arylsulfatase A-like enzyme
MNVVVIVSDTLRQDHLGCYGNDVIETPHLDALSERAVTFDRCYAASFPTVPMRADLFTGKYTFNYLGWAPLTSDEATLAECLSKGGYRTFGVTDTPFFIRRGYGYDRGFMDFRWVRGQNFGLERSDVTHDWRYESDRFAPRTMSAAEKWLERHHQQKFFLYVDTWDPHEPWDPPDYYVEHYYQGYAGQKSVHPCYWDWREAGLSLEQLELAHACYCGEVTMVDRWVGRLLERIESLGLLDDTMILFTADHGFCFGEHGLFGKHKFRSDLGFFAGYTSDGPGDRANVLYRSPETGEVVAYDAPVSRYFDRSPLWEEIARVPLFVYIPGVEPGRSEALVTVPDLMPTILDAVGLEIPDAAQGSSLVPLLEGAESGVHDFVVSTPPLCSIGATVRFVDDLPRNIKGLLPATITSRDWSLIYSVAGDPVELYHLPSDPQQQSNVFTDNRDVAADLHRKFVGLLERLGTRENLLAPRRSLY